VDANTKIIGVVFKLPVVVVVGDRFVAVARTMGSKDLTRRFFELDENRNAHLRSVKSVTLTQVAGRRHDDRMIGGEKKEKQ